MSSQKIKQQRLALARFLAYVLGHRPDEFGLVPDEQGFIPIKDVLMALSEEEGWRHVRQPHLEELIREPDRSGLEIQDKLIRLAPAVSKLTLGKREPVTPPKVLYHAARHQAYPTILDKGLLPAARPFVSLSLTPETAMRIGRRRDAEPVLLTIHATLAHESGVVFYRPQELIYIVESLAPEFFTGPPLPKERPAQEKKKEAPPAPPPPGSFYMDPARIQDPFHRPDKSLKRKRSDIPDWKRSQRQERRKKGEEK